MKSPYLKKIVAFIEKVGDSERYQRVEAETEQLLSQAKVQVDRIIVEASTKSDQLVKSAHAARIAFTKEWEPSEGDQISLDEDGALESLQLTDVTVSIARKGKRSSEIIVSTRDGKSVKILHTGSATVSKVEGSEYPVKPRQDSAQ
jgi:dsDNA-specific endonuclease/ATPase MutS2